MYKRESGGWLKHYDFLLLDMICLQIAFLLSFVVLGRGFNPYSHILYRKMALYLELADVVVVFFFDSFSGVLKKGYYRNFVSTVQHAAIVFALFVLLLFTRLHTTSICSLWGNISTGVLLSTLYPLRVSSSRSRASVTGLQLT